VIALVVPSRDEGEPPPGSLAIDAAQNDMKGNQARDSYYHLTMARGWESKSVESQIEDKQETWSRNHVVSREELEVTRKRESLESSRRGLLKELESTKSDRLRGSLQAALKYLEDELRKLG
jgi:hypothetical protein